jgi:hypothetical protein
LAVVATLAVFVGFAPASGAAVVSSGPFPRMQVVGSNLDNPRHLSIEPGGGVLVAEAGKGGTGTCAPNPEGGDPSCFGSTGSVARIDGGLTTALLTGLPSVAPADGTGASGPADVIDIGGGNRAMVFQDVGIDHTGANPFGPDGALLGKLAISLAGGAPVALADLAAYEAAHDPDGGAGAEPGTNIDSDPYALTRYQTGYAVVDAAGNDLLFVDSIGTVSTLAVFPTQMVDVPAGVVGPAPATIEVQSVPTSVRLGPDGALYVGELTGFPFAVGKARVWRVVAGSAPTLFASGFTTISDLAFDPDGNLLVLQISTKGLAGDESPGALIRVEADGTRTLLAREGLVAPTGLAVAANGTIYISNFGIFAGSGAGPHGQVVALPPATAGYRLVGANGAVYTFGDSGFHGGADDLALTEGVVGTASTPSGHGYWLVAADGGIFSYGDAVFYGSTGATRLNQPIVGMATTPSGHGYWLVAADGGIFSYGDAVFYGSTGAVPLNQPIVGMAATAAGYWLVAADGGIFSYGGAVFYGSTGAMHLNQPIVAMSASPDELGYWFVAADGGIFSYGAAAFYGSTASFEIGKPVVAVG